MDQRGRDSKHVKLNNKKKKHLLPLYTKDATKFHSFSNTNYSPKR